ncbi:unnamed protein product [marine sediment metagenome]|uniref:Uncharacterized protein n=1 Tax=marine sediment metagenome TaxID=412755 RepID=X1JZ42_9ZZZZ
METHGKGNRGEEKNLGNDPAKGHNFKNYLGLGHFRGGKALS